MFLVEQREIKWIERHTAPSRGTIKKIRGLWKSGRLNPFLEHRHLALNDSASLWRSNLAAAAAGMPAPSDAVGGDLAEAIEALSSLSARAANVEGLTGEDVTFANQLENLAAEYGSGLEELQRRSVEAQEELGWPTTGIPGSPGLLPNFTRSIAEELLLCCASFEEARCCGGHMDSRCGYRLEPTPFEGCLRLRFECRQNWNIAQGTRDELRRCEEIHGRAFEECKPTANNVLRLHKQIAYLRDQLSKPEVTGV